MVYSQDEGKDADLTGKCNPEDCSRGRAESGIIYLSIQDTREQRHCIVRGCKDGKYFPFADKKSSVRLYDILHPSTQMPESLGTEFPPAA
jgi:hypothetical protein